ncbi:MAG TPA: hypothetical protein VJ957_03575 [Longimicrobiales bacterium]|nr:hypothetical protein [Longimicrobiales bacterium]
MNKSLVTMALLAAGAVSACGDSQPLGPPGPSYFTAEINGAVERQFDGQDFFAPDTPPSGSVRFTIAAFQGQTADGQPIENINLTRYDGSRPPVGSYSLHLVPHSSDENNTGYAAYYWFRDGGLEYEFAADVGELVVTRSTSDYVEGHFTLDAFQYCVIDETTSPVTIRYPVGQAQCIIPDQAPADAPRIHVSGEFGVTPLGPVQRM